MIDIQISGINNVTKNLQGECVKVGERWVFNYLLTEGEWNTQLLVRIVMSNT